MKIGHLEQGWAEDIEQRHSGYSQVSFMYAFTVFRVGRVIRDRGWCSVCVPHQPADNKMVKVIRDGTSRNRFAPDSHVN